jgi:AcrR family transcriptional regulator
MSARGERAAVALDEAPRGLGGGVEAQGQGDELALGSGDGVGSGLFTGASRGGEMIHGRLRFDALDATSGVSGARHSATVVFCGGGGGLSAGSNVRSFPYPLVMGRDRQILQAALELFHERGFGGVGVDEIGARAGVTGPAIYRHFSGKDEVLAALLDEALDGLLVATGGGPSDPLDELEHLVRTHAKYALENRQLTSIYAREERSLAQPFRRRFEARKREYMKRWIDCLLRCFPDRDVEDVTVAVHGVFGLLNGSGGWPATVARAPRAHDVLSGLALEGLRSLEAGEVASAAPQSRTARRSRAKAA